MILFQRTETMAIGSFLGYNSAKNAPAKRKVAGVAHYVSTPGETVHESLFDPSRPELRQSS
jgi:hypothetical protein